MVAASATGVCESCGAEVPFAEIAKGYDVADGRLAILDAEDFAGLPAADGKSVEVTQFVELSQIKPTMFNKTYCLGKC